MTNERKWRNNYVPYGRIKRQKLRPRPDVLLGSDMPLDNQALELERLKRRRLIRLLRGEDRDKPAA